MLNTFSAFRHRNYRLYFAGVLISALGMFMQQVAVSWVVYSLTNSRFLLGTVSAIGSLPLLLFSPFGGVLADRVDKRRLLLCTQSAAVVPPLILAALVHFGLIHVSHLAMLAFCMGLIASLDMPARQAFVIEMVGKEDLLNAIALNSSTFNAARVVGPSIGGLVLAAAGAPVCFLANGLSFLAVVGALALMRLPRRRNATEPEPVIASILSGFRYLRRNAMVAALVSLVAVTAIFGVSYRVLLVVFARDVMHGGPKTLGFLMSAVGTGALVGALGLASLARARRRMQIAFLSNFGLAAALLGFSFTHGLSAGAVLLVLAGMMQAGFVPMANTIIQSSVPDEVRGRVMGVYAMCFAGMEPVGSFVAGSLAEKFGAPEAVRLGVGVFSAYCAVQLLVAARRGWLQRETVVPGLAPPRQPVTAGIPMPLNGLPRPSPDGWPSARANPPTGADTDGSEPGGHPASEE